MPSAQTTLVLMTARLPLLPQSLPLPTSAVPSQTQMAAVADDADVAKNSPRGGFGVW